jgi:hypothetical protein
MDERFRDVLIYDIECSAVLGSPSSTHKLRLFGCYSFNDEKYYMYYDKSEIMDIIERHKYLVGFNNVGGSFHNDFYEGYDNRVLFNQGYDNIINRDKNDIYRFSKKINIDLFLIIKKRASAMKVSQGMLGDLLMRYSLDYITRVLDLVDDTSAKLEFDYSLLQKESSEWTPEEKRIIEEYSLRDLEVTKKLYIWIEDYFKSFRDYVEEKDIDNKTYLTCSTAVFTYKAICKSMEWKEEYSDVKEKASYGGGYVSFPSMEYAKGNIYCFDFSSLYPSIMHMCNIFSPNIDGWYGEPNFKTDGIYNNKEQGRVEKLIKQIYEQRLVFKKQKDPREYSLKIQMNAAYGLLGNPSFSHLYNRTSASDVTRLGRQFIKLARRRFMDAGYEVIYSDTDSTFLIDPFNDKDKLFLVKKQIVDEIQSSVPFPYPKQKKVIDGVEIEAGFDMGLDAEISDMFFFKGDVGDKETDSEMDDYDHKNKPKKLIKKNYIYRKTNGSIVVKNLGVRKKSLSAISRKLFWDVLVPKISEERVVKFSEAYLNNTINSLLEKDLSLVEQRFSIKPFDSYKLASQMQAQISKKLGPGIHFLIPVKRDIYDSGKIVTMGIGKKYIESDDFKKYKLSIQDIDFSKVWAELSYFIKDSQNTLSAWL